MIMGNLSIYFMCCHFYLRMCYKITLGSFIQSKINSSTSNMIFPWKNINCALALKKVKYAFTCGWKNNIHTKKYKKITRLNLFAVTVSFAFVTGYSNLVLYDFPMNHDGYWLAFCVLMDCCVTFFLECYFSFVWDSFFFFFSLWS